ncbi:hypothetical protein BCR36DRAFT_581309 [Piromyces finnis]|uniref:Cryptic loci regulator 2 N-terminal domain-containing protein n=1 Tax=Piromyces finnis TaxID=1754191 RepID=A0A1Y1VGX5_9FUNG|nr:hypothetical protein BCR36DRAFT_581309 [Piromyces finnis]|eukprot:ORX55272.1 hypothetical protein BCR36DRAFT_581309 [Piromyces finnis]
MSYIINDGSISNYPEAPWKEAQPDIVKTWLTNMNIKSFPNNYKLFSKVEKSMTKATKVKTNLYGHPSGNYFETPLEAKVHINYLLGKTNVCHCIYCKPSNPLYMKQSKRKFEDDEESEKILIKNSKLPLKKAWNHYKNRQSAIKVESKAEEWKWYNGYRENEIIWAPIFEDENNTSHSIFWTFQIVKRLSSLEVSDSNSFNKLISFEKVIKYISKTIIKPSSKVNLNEILKDVEASSLNINNSLWNKPNILQSNIYSSNTEQVNDFQDEVIHTVNSKLKEVDSEIQKTIERKKKDKENLMTLMSGSYDDEDEDDDDDDFVLSDEGDEYYTDDSEDLIRKPPSDSGSEVSVGSVLNDTQNNSVQQIETLGYICRKLPLQNISIEQEEEDNYHSDTKKDTSQTYYFIPFKIIIPFLMYDPCSKNNILWNRAVMQAIDLSSSFSIPRLNKDSVIDTSSFHTMNDKNLLLNINEDTFLNKKETRNELEYFRFGAEQLYIGDLLRLDLSNNSTTRWIKTVNNFERVDKHEYLEVDKIVEIRNKGKSSSNIEITGKIYFNVFAEKLDNQLNNTEGIINSKKEIISPISSPSISSRAIIHSNNNLSTMSSSSSISSLFIPEFSDILWINSGETRTIHLNEICGRYYVNCPTLERKMRISSEKPWNKDNSVFGSSKQELLILKHENSFQQRNKILNQ